jgi:hypothetical protein
MTVLRMLVFRPEGIAEPPSNALLNSRVAEVVEVKKPEAVAPVLAGSAALDISPPAAQENEPLAVAVERENVSEVSASVLVDASVNTSVNTESLRVVSLIAADFFDNQQWLKHFSRLPFSGLLKSVMAECVLLAVENDGKLWRFVINKENAQLFNHRQAGQAAEVLGTYFSMPVLVEIADGKSDLQTPAQYMQEIKQARYDKALIDLQGDAGVQLLMQRYGAEIDLNSVEAIITGEPL